MLGTTKRHLLFLFSNISEFFWLFRQTNRKFKIVQLYESYKNSVIKLVKEQKKSQLKYYQMVLYTIKNLLPVKDILKTLPSSGINKYIKIL